MYRKGGPCGLKVRLGIGPLGEPLLFRLTARKGYAYCPQFAIRPAKRVLNAHKACSGLSTFTHYPVVYSAAASALNAERLLSEHGLPAVVKGCRTPVLTRRWRCRVGRRGTTVNLCSRSQRMKAAAQRPHSAGRAAKVWARVRFLDRLAPVSRTLAAKRPADNYPDRVRQET